jgi:hypothetical protein
MNSTARGVPFMVGFPVRIFGSMTIRPCQFMPVALQKPHLPIPEFYHPLWDDSCMMAILKEEP